MDTDTKILLVGGSKDLCEIISERLSNDYGLEISAIVHDGEAALEKILILQPQLILMDIILPKLDGLSVIKVVNSQFHTRYMPKIVIMSAVENEKIIKRAFDLGVQYYFIKPVNIEVLSRKIIEIKSET